MTIQIDKSNFRIISVFNLVKNSVILFLNIKLSILAKLCLILALILLLFDLLFDCHINSHEDWMYYLWEKL